MIYFKPYYKSEMSEIICSIPADNISKTLIRKPVTKDRLKQCITMLKKKELKEEYKDINAAKELLSTNKLTDIAKFIVYMWKEIDSADSVSKSKKDAYEKAKERFIQEWALVTKSPIDKTRDKLGATLKI